MRKNNVCRTCAEINPAAPIWAPETQICRPCTDADGGSFWDSVAGKCVPACPDTAPKATSEHVCRKCDETLDKGRFWDGEDCVAACPYTWDENGICKTCEELNSKTPFWDGEKCINRCPTG